MTHENKPEFAQILTAMAEIYDKELSEISVQLYWNCLKHLDFDHFREACAKCVETSKFMPKPAEILQNASGGPRETHAIREWDAIQAAVSSVGAYQSVEFDDPVTAKAATAVGGWSELCRPTEDEHWLRKRFIETWLAYDQVRTEIEQQPKNRCRGLLEADGGQFHTALVGSYAGRNLKRLNAPTNRKELPPPETEPEP